MDRVTLRALGVGAAAGLFAGAGLEVFMVTTGFYKVAARKQAEHRVEDKTMLADAAAARRQRLAALRPQQPARGGSASSPDHPQAPER